MSNQDSKNLPAGWYKAKIFFEILAILVGTILIPILISHSTKEYSKSLKEREIGIRYVELAINILREDPAKQDMEDLRTWAIAVINKYSSIPLSEKSKNELMKKKLEIKTGGNIVPPSSTPPSAGIGSTPYGDKTYGD